MERATQIVIELLAKGSSQSEVAELTGNSASAISQCATKYHAQISAKQADSQLATTGHGKKLDRIESMLADKMIGMIALETDIMKVGMLLTKVNAAVRRDEGEVGGSGSRGTVVNQQVVQLQLSPHLQRTLKVITNSNNDVVAVDGRDLTPASMNHVNSLAGIESGGTIEKEYARQAHDDIISISLTGLHTGS